MRRGCVLLISGSKGQKSRSQCIDNWKWFMFHNCFRFYFYHHETSYNKSPWAEDVSCWFWGQKVKDQGHNALITENGLCRIIHFPLHLSSRNLIQRLPISRGCALLSFGSKGQRGHNSLITENSVCSIVAFPLHISSWNSHKTFHDSVMCPFDFGVNRSEVKVTMHWFLTLSKLYDVAVGFVSPLISGSVLLHLRSPKGSCCSISDDLSCSWKWFCAYLLSLCI